MRIGQRSANDGTRSGFMPLREPGPKGGRCASTLGLHDERPLGVDSFLCLLALRHLNLGAITSFEAQ